MQEKSNKEKKNKDLLPDITKETKGKRTVGRPTIFSPDLGEEICSRIASGESLKKITDDDDMPSMRSIFLWFSQGSNEEEGGHKNVFLHNYERAGDARADYMFDQTLEIADGAPLMVVGDDKSDSARMNAEKLKVETRKWYLSKFKPKKYGINKVDVTSDGKQIASNGITIIDSHEEEGSDS
jgi:hypothetical protein